MLLGGYRGTVKRFIATKAFTTPIKRIFSSVKQISLK